MAPQQNQTNTGKENYNMYLIAKNFILFPGLFEIIVQSAYGSAKHYFACT